MSPDEEKQILRWGESLAEDRGLTIRLARTDDEPGEALARFCAELVRLAPRVALVREDPEPGAPPAIRIGERISYHAVPLARELAPFLEALTLSAQPAPPLPDGLQEALERIELPAGLKLYVAQHCPHCPAVVRRVVPLALACPLVRLAVIDGGLFEAQARHDEVRAAPTLLLDGTFRWTGGIDPLEVAAIMADRDPAQLGADSLEGILKEGRAAQVAEMMAERGKIFPAFLDLLAHEKWPVRLGAMVAAEHLVQTAPALTGALEESLWNRFDGAEERVQGDLLHVLGEVGGPGSLAKIDGIAASAPAEEVREAAADAADAIRNRAGG